MPRPSPGKRFAPKMTMMIARMINSSGSPMRPMVKLPSPEIVPSCARLFLSFFLIFLAISAIAVRSAAQFVSGVNLVEVYATVSDARGEPVTGLAEGDFIVDEDGVRQEIRTFARGRLPLSIAIGIDRSFSVPRDTLTAATRAVSGLLGELAPADQSMVLAIGAESEVLAPLSTDRQPAQDALRALTTWGTTPLYDATARAVDAIQHASGRRALVLISDGTDRYSAMSASEVIAHVRRRDVLVYTVAVGRTQPPVFAELAAVTGGRSAHVTSLSRLPATLDGIARELRSQYLLGYVPANPDAERGRWRSIHVSVARPGVRVRARDGYVVP